MTAYTDNLRLRRKYQATKNPEESCPHCSTPPVVHGGNSFQNHSPNCPLMNIPPFIQKQHKFTATFQDRTSGNEPPQEVEAEVEADSPEEATLRAWHLASKTGWDLMSTVAADGADWEQAERDALDSGMPEWTFD